jgi:hypothetical protein
MNIEEIRTEILRLVGEGLNAPPKILSPQELEKLWEMKE